MHIERTEDKLTANKEILNKLMQNTKPYDPAIARYINHTKQYVRFYEQLKDHWVEQKKMLLKNPNYELESWFHRNTKKRVSRR